MNRVAPIGLLSLMVILVTAGAVYTYADFGNEDEDERPRWDPGSRRLDEELTRNRSAAEDPNETEGESTTPQTVTLPPNKSKPQLPDEPPPGTAFIYNPMTGETELAALIQLESPPSKKKTGPTVSAKSIAESQGWKKDTIQTITIAPMSRTGQAPRGTEELKTLTIRPAPKS